MNKFNISIEDMTHSIVHQRNKVTLDLKINVALLRILLCVGNHVEPTKLSRHNIFLAPGRP